MAGEIRKCLKCSTKKKRREREREEKEEEEEEEEEEREPDEYLERVLFFVTGRRC